MTLPIIATVEGSMNAVGPVMFCVPSTITPGAKYAIQRILSVEGFLYIALIT